MPKRAVLLINIGSPDLPTTSSVRQYLAQFLMDKYVIDLPWWRRWLLVYGLILPIRSRRSAGAYQSVWMPEGSPLVTITNRLVERLNRVLSIPVYLGMRYGHPSIPSQIRRLGLTSGDELIVIPMYPQYAESSTRTAIEAVTNSFSDNLRPLIRVKTPFYAEKAYIDWWANRIRQTPAPFTVFSFHGLPVRHIQKLDFTHRHCLVLDHCCEGNWAVHATCYRHQCIRTAQMIADSLGLQRSEWIVSFQSRLGRDEWLTPSTPDTLIRLAQQGHSHVRIACPSFTTDCLETLEEIKVEARQTFLGAGGAMFDFISCPNDSEEFVQLVQSWITKSDDNSLFTTA